MSRSFGAILGVLGVLSCAGLRAQELTPGGPAKALAFAQCVHGKPVTGLAKGVVHLIHFWGEEPAAVFDVEDKFAALQKKFGDKLNIIAVLLDSEDYTLAAVQDFYKEDAAKPTFPIAWDVGGSLHQAWVSASGQEGRVAFVVDADGKLMWTDGIGFLDVVIDQVMTGKADAKALRDDTDAAKKLFMRVLLVASLKPAGARAELDKLLAAYPALATMALPAVYNALMEEAEGVAHAVLLQPLLCDVLIKSEDVASLNGLAWAIVDPEAELEKRDLVTAKRAAQQAVLLTKEKDAAVLDTLARVFFWEKDYAQAVAWQQKAVKLEQGAAQEELAATLKEYEQLAAGK